MKVYIMIIHHNGNPIYGGWFTERELAESACENYNKRRTDDSHADFINVTSEKNEALF